MKIIDWMIYAKKKIKNNITAHIDITLLLCFVLKCSKEYLISTENRKLTIYEMRLLKTVLKRRIYGEPIEYIIKKKEFWSLPLYVSSSVLIPRPDTELLVQVVIDKISKHKKKKLDLGTGSGAIALAIAQENSYCQVLGVDNCFYALSVANYNLYKLKINNVTFKYSHWFSNIIGEKFNFIVCNPPYLSYRDFYLSNKNLKFEPYYALVSGQYGIECIQYIIQKSINFIICPGWLCIEHCYKQKNIVEKLFKDNFFIHVHSYKDYSGRFRVTVGLIKN
ncbi:N5-glutamine methyltransferase, release factors activity modulator [Buchnera aphidicola (Cinara tujafilina)]|uniref:peptide chain release factor N(5)-glutamine methyltransferase n=1 Tax=Buchnera aphidicola (Cinara tujafilina) TaxID=261317 RepID=F7WZ54_9GAMM|nr:peptide chain release factor N(5)-glutamine methyltransferase [Buchnera aphidicola]AEH39707.1 N5-glutamine methyltransferase, release factors activity modulator [Buchnera aphidicola (Cinara tujafilina)]